MQADLCAKRDRSEVVDIKHVDDAWRIILRTPTRTWFRWIEFAGSLAGIVMGTLIAFLASEGFREQGPRALYFWSAVVGLILSTAVMATSHLLKD